MRGGQRISGHIPMMPPELRWPIEQILSGGTVAIAKTVTRIHMTVAQVRVGAGFVADACRPLRRVARVRKGPA